MSYYDDIVMQAQMRYSMYYSTYAAGRTPYRLSAAGGGDFYYEGNESYRKFFGKYARKYHFKGAFDGMMHRWTAREEFWGYLATFLYTTQTAPVRRPYLDLDTLLKGKDFFVLTTNQDTQFVKLYPEDKVAEIQGDHRFFQCDACCTDDTWDAVKPVQKMMDAMGDGTSVPRNLVPRCPRCGGSMCIHMVGEKVDLAAERCSVGSAGRLVSPQSLIVILL